MEAVRVNQREPLWFLTRHYWCEAGLKIKTKNTHTHKICKHEQKHHTRVEEL